uniref:Uncharacterized protein n=1 Tax=Magallana gigas TaxID=29159 RepID=K1QUP1_MAGGI
MDFKMTGSNRAAAIVTAECLIDKTLNKETFEQYPRPILYNVASNKAVDGIKPDQNYTDEQCSFSKAEKTATWWVNLNSVYNINDIRMYYANATLSFLVSLLPVNDSNGLLVNLFG